jgi:hypothetical protein
MQEPPPQHDANASAVAVAERAARLAWQQAAQAAQLAAGQQAGHPAGLRPLDHLRCSSALFNHAGDDLAPWGRCGLPWCMLFVQQLPHLRPTPPGPLHAQAAGPFLSGPKLGRSRHHSRRRPPALRWPSTRMPQPCSSLQTAQAVTSQRKLLLLLPNLTCCRCVHAHLIIAPDVWCASRQLRSHLQNAAVHKLHIALSAGG